MADTETPQVVSTASQGTSAAAAPVANSAPVSAPSSAPASPASPAATPAAPSGSEAASASSPAVKAASETSAPVETSLLGSDPTPEVKDAPADAPVEKKPEDGKPDGEKPADGEEKPADGTEPEAALPQYEAFVLPEGIKADPEGMALFAKTLGEFEASKPTHAEFQEFGQKFFDMHIQRLSEAAQNTTDYYVALHNQTKNADADALRNDPVIGGSGDAKVFEKNMKGLVNFLAANGGTKEEVTEFRKYVQERGVDGSLPIARVLNNLKSKIERYETESSKMLAGTKPAVNKPQPGKGIMQSLYGGQKS